MPSPNADTSDLIAKVLGGDPPSAPPSVVKRLTDIEALFLHYWLRDMIGQPNNHSHVSKSAWKTGKIMMSDDAAALLDEPHWSHVQKLITIHTQDRKHKWGKKTKFMLLINKAFRSIFPNDNNNTI